MTKYILQLIPSLTKTEMSLLQQYSIKLPSSEILDLKTVLNESQPTVSESCHLKWQTIIYIPAGWQITPLAPKNIH